MVVSILHKYVLLPPTKLNVVVNLLTLTYATLFSHFVTDWFGLSEFQTFLRVNFEQKIFC